MDLLTIVFCGAISSGTTGVSTFYVFLMVLTVVFEGYYSSGLTLTFYYFIELCLL